MNVIEPKIIEDKFKRLELGDIIVCQYGNYMLIQESGYKYIFKGIGIEGGLFGLYTNLESITEKYLERKDSDWKLYRGSEYDIQLVKK